MHTPSQLHYNGLGQFDICLPQVRLAMGPVTVTDMPPPPPRQPTRSAAVSDPIADDEPAATERHAEAAEQPEAAKPDQPETDEPGQVDTAVATPMGDYGGAGDYQDGGDGGFSYDDGGATATLTTGAASCSGYRGNMLLWCLVTGSIQRCTSTIQ